MSNVVIDWKQDTARTAYWVYLNGELVDNGSTGSGSKGKFYFTPENANLEGVVNAYERNPTTYGRILKAAGVTFSYPTALESLKAAGEWKFVFCGEVLAKRLVSQTPQDAEFAQLIAYWIGGNIDECDHSKFMDLIKGLGWHYPATKLYRALYIPNEQLQLMSEGVKVSVRMGPGTQERVLFSWTEEESFAKTFLQEAKPPAGASVVVVSATIPGDYILARVEDFGRWADEHDAMNPPWWWTDPKYARTVNVSEFSEVDPLKGLVDVFNDEKEWLVVMGTGDTFEGVEVLEGGEFHPLATPTTPKRSKLLSRRILC